MHKNKYCYPNSDVLINKLNIKNEKSFAKAEIKLTYIRVQELEKNNPIKGDFDFEHLKRIHHYIFQDIYEWAGKERTVEIGKGNLFCLTTYIPTFAESIFKKYFNQCYENRNDKEKFIAALAENYGDLNALHPFREGNGRAQREFARELCLVCGYQFDLSCTTHEKMLHASKLSFDIRDNSEFIKIFSEAVTPLEQAKESKKLYILTSNDIELGIKNSTEYKYDEYTEDEYLKYYKEKTKTSETHRRITNESIDRKMICKTNKSKDKHEINSYSYDEYEEKDLHS